MDGIAQYVSKNAVIKAKITEYTEYDLREWILSVKYRSNSIAHSLN